MKKTIDIVLIVFIFLFVYFLQTNFFTWFNIAGIMPNLFIVLIMTIGLFLSRNYGFAFGVIFGLVIDIWIGARIGMHATALGIVGIAAGLLGKSFSNSNKLNIIFITVFLTVVFEISIYFLTLLNTSIKNIELISFLKILSIEMLYNTILIVIIYPILCKFGEKLEKDFNNKGFLNFLY